MNDKPYKSALASAVCFFLISSVGCTSLPWRAKKVAATVNPAQQYAQQAVENIKYDDPVVFTQDYQPSPVPSSSYTAPTKSYSTASRSSSGSCSSGCCN